MKLSVAAYSFRDSLATRGTAEEIAKAGMRLEDVIDLSALYGLDGVELTSYYFPKDVSTEYLMNLKQQCFRLGLDISGTAIGNDFCHKPGAERDEQLALTREWIDYAATMGAKPQPSAAVSKASMNHWSTRRRRAFSWRWKTTAGSRTPRTTCCASSTA
jgi:sugar phosphate isomerase/epimerase